MRQLESRARKALEIYHMIEEGDRVAVGVSGGKDSVALLYTLAGLRRYYPKSFTLTAFTLDPCFGGVQTDYGPIEALCRELSVPYYIRRTDLGEIIFETYDKEQVFDSFDANPFHYIVKGETQETKIEDILERAIIKLEGGRREIISLTCAGERRNIPIADLLYFEVDHRIIRAHYGRNETFEFYSTIGKLENLLPGKGFERAHRAFLVSLPHVAGFGGSEISMDNGDIIPLGRTYAKAFRQALDKGAGE